MKQNKNFFSSWILGVLNFANCSISFFYLCLTGSSGDESDTSRGVPSNLDVVPRNLDISPLSPSSDSYYNRDSDKKVKINHEIKKTKFTNF